MIKQIILLIKTSFSKEPFEQEIVFRFSIYDVLFAVLLIIAVLWVIFR